MSEETVILTREEYDEFLRERNKLNEIFELQRLRSKNYYEKHKDEVMMRKAGSSLEWYRKNKDKVNQKRRENYRKKKELQSQTVENVC
jgi:hypothetical protein